MGLQDFAEAQIEALPARNEWPATSAQVQRGRIPIRTRRKGGEAERVSADDAVDVAHLAAGAGLGLAI